MAEEIQSRVIICWDGDDMKALLKLICFAEVDVDQDTSTLLINHNIRPFQDTMRIKVPILWHIICFPEQATKGGQEGAPERKITGTIRVDVLVHPSENARVDGKYKLWCSLQPSLDPLESCFQSKVIRGEVMTSSMVDILHTAQDILAVPMRTCVGHQFHEDAQAGGQGWHGLKTKEVGKVEPLSNVRQDVALGRAGKPKTL